MSNPAQPLNNKLPIINPDGTPTEYFIKWAQQFSRGAASTEDLTGKADKSIVLTAGVGLSGGGDLSANRTFDAEEQEILDQLTTTQGSLLFRGASDWEALGPGTSGQFLKTNGASADPAWATAGGGGGSGLIAVVPISAVSSIDIEDFAGLGSSAVRLLFDITVSTDAVRPIIRYKLSGSYTSASNYRVRLESVASSGTSDTINSQGMDHIPLMGDAANFSIGNDSGNHFIADITLPSPDSTTLWKMCYGHTMTRGPTDSFLPAEFWALWDGTSATAALEGVRLLISAGTMTGVCYVFQSPDTV